MVLLFTDVVGSVAIKSQIGTVPYSRLISRHDELFRSILQSISGADVVKDTGDGFMARFGNTADAVNAALRFQYALRHEVWDPEPLRVRIGIHLGEIAELDQDVDGRPKLVGLAADL